MYRRYILRSTVLIYRLCSINDCFWQKVQYFAHLMASRLSSIYYTVGKALKEASHTRTKQESRYFQRFSNLYRRFVLAYSNISPLFIVLLRADSPDTIEDFTVKKKSSSKNLIDSFTSPPVMELTKKDLPYIV